MAEIEYIKGDATCPQAKGAKIIAHICNDRGGWGNGFVMAVSRRWPGPEAAYLKWHGERNDNDFALGSVQFVQVEQYIWVANMIGQHGMTRSKDGPPIRYEAVEKCLGKGEREGSGDRGERPHAPDRLWSCWGKVGKNRADHCQDAEREGRGGDGLRFLTGQSEPRTLNRLTRICPSGRVARRSIFLDFDLEQWAKEP